ncbi:MAG: hypothetical protein L3K17_04275 [Thermoplasmata archaeon]|nr:hypothetical protein [Thermoplasmata archaeon]
MLDAAQLEAAVLEFRHKSFSFERLAEVDGTEYAVFSRRETETESKLRPKVIRLFVVAPRSRLLYEEETESLWLSPDGITPGPRDPGTAQEAGAEAAEFREQGLPWKRATVPGGVAYLPQDRAAQLATADGLAALGFDS